MGTVSSLANKPQEAPNWEALIEAYSDGAGDIEIARLLKITKKKFYALIEESPAFAEFVERGRTLSEAWWYERGRTALFDKTLNVALYNFIMKNRFGWADKIDTSTAISDETLNKDQLQQELKNAIKRLSKKNPELLSGANLNLEVDE